MILPAGAANARGDDALCLFETDRGNGALECANGRTGSVDPIAVTCRFEHTGFFALETDEGPVRVHALGRRSLAEQEGETRVREEVLLVDEEGRPLHTLVQWSQQVRSRDAELLRRRFKVVDVDHEGADELCIESLVEAGPGRDETARSGRFRPTRHHAGFDAFRWDGERFVRAEALDGSCPSSGYRLFVEMPAPVDPIASRRDQR